MNKESRTVPDISTPLEFPLAGDVRIEPDPRYRQLREHRPVCPVAVTGERPAWLVTRYEDARAALTDPRLVRRDTVDERTAQAMSVAGPAGRTALIYADPPALTASRQLISHHFNARRVESLRPRAQQIVDALIDRMLAEGGPLDLVTAFARPLPVRIICELLGLPSAESEHIRESVELLMHTHGADPDAVRDAFVLLHGELGRAVRERRRSPGDDLISDLIQSDRADEPLTDGELVGLALLLFVTGHETTMTQLASSALALLQDDGQRDALIARPELIGSCVEELLRFVPLGHAGLPFAAAEDLELAGVRIPRGDLVFVSKLSANRDERAFPEADVLDITRSPNRHIAFSHGPHHCLGAALARMEMQVALGSLFSRMPTLRLAVRFDEVEWRTGSIQRGPVRLPVTWED